MFNLEQLRMFVVTADTGSFSACARQLGKAQSAVSQGIANLEIDLGVEIFDRATRRATLTSEGERLLSYARIVLQQTQELDAAAKSIVREEEPCICIAVESALPTAPLGRLLRAFAQQFPATQVELLSIASPDIVALVDSGRVDLGLMFSDMSFKREVDLCFIGALPLYPVCAPEHPLAQLRDIDIAHLSGYTQLICRGVAGAGVDHEVPISAMQWSSNNTAYALELILQGNGWGYLPVHMVATHLADGRLHKLAMRLDEKPWSPTVDLVKQKNRADGPAARWLAEKLMKVLD
ncbi:MAG: LysR family transcriptional regulator [Pseudomonadales bacterium]